MSRTKAVFIFLALYFSTLYYYEGQVERLNSAYDRLENALELSYESLEDQAYYLQSCYIDTIFDTLTYIWRIP